MLSVNLSVSHCLVFIAISGYKSVHIKNMCFPHRENGTTCLSSISQFTERTLHFLGLLTLKPLPKGMLSVRFRSGALFYVFSQTSCGEKTESNYKMLFRSRKIVSKTESYLAEI